MRLVAFTFMATAALLVAWNLLNAFSKGHIGVGIGGGSTAVVLLVLAFGLLRQSSAARYGALGVSSLGSLMFGYNAYVAVTTLPGIIRDQPETSYAEYVIFAVVGLVVSVGSLVTLLVSRTRLPDQPLCPTPTAAEAPASGAGERRR